MAPPRGARARVRPRGARSPHEHPACRPRRALAHVVGVEARNLAMPDGDGERAAGTRCVYYTLSEGGDGACRGPLYYMSEAVPAALNPEWHSVDHARASSRSAAYRGRVLLEIRAVRPGEVGAACEGAHVLRAAVDLNGLAYAGSSMPVPATQFPPNTVIFELTDGFYVPPQHAHAFELEPRDADADMPPLVPPAAEDDLLAGDLVSHSAEVAAEGTQLLLGQYVSAAEEAAGLKGKLDSARRRVTQAEAALAREAGEGGGGGDLQRRVALRHAREHRRAALHERISAAERAAARCRGEASGIQASIVQREKALRHAERELQASKQRLSEADALLQGEGGRGALVEAKKQLHVRRWSLVRQVADVYPILKEYFDSGSDASAAGDAGPGAGVGSPPPQYSIAGVCLNFQNKPHNEAAHATSAARGKVAARAAGSGRTPQASAAAADMEPDQLVAVAFGYVAHVLVLLTRYLGILPRYPVRAAASRSSVCDTMVVNRRGEGFGVGRDAGRKRGEPRRVTVSLPLHAEAGVEPSHFAFAVVQLNKNIEQILQMFGMSGLGPKHTLHNLATVMDAAGAPVHQGG